MHQHVQQNVVLPFLVGSYAFIITSPLNMPAFAWTPERHGPKAPNSVCVHTGHTSNAARLLPGRCHGGGSGAKSMQSLLPTKLQNETNKKTQRNTTKHNETQRNNMKQKKIK